MENNDVLKKIRYALDLKDPQMVTMFKEGGVEMSRSHLSLFFKTPDEDEYQEISDEMLFGFLDGLIVERRGPEK